MEKSLSEKTRTGKGEIVIYQPDEITKLEVRLQNETVWLTQMQIATIFNVGRPAVTKHINNIYKLLVRLNTKRDNLNHQYLK